MFEDYSDTKAMQVIGMQVIVCTFDSDNFQTQGMLYFQI